MTAREAIQAAKALAFVWGAILALAALNKLTQAWELTRGGKP